MKANSQKQRCLALRLTIRLYLFGRISFGSDNSLLILEIKQAKKPEVRA